MIKMFTLKLDHPHHRMEFKKAPCKGPWAGQTLTSMPPDKAHKRDHYHQHHSKITPLNKRKRKKQVPQPSGLSRMQTQIMVGETRVRIPARDGELSGSHIDGSLSVLALELQCRASCHSWNRRYLYLYGAGPTSRGPSPQEQASVKKKKLFEIHFKNLCVDTFEQHCQPLFHLLMAPTQALEIIFKDFKVFSNF